MQFTPNIPLKPLEVTRLPFSSTGGRPSAPTELTPFDLSGILAKAPSGNVEGGPSELRHQAQQLVAQTFFGTLLKQMRNSPFRSELLEGGRGGQAFSPLFDQKMIEHMSRGAGNKLVNSIVRQFEANAAYRKHQTKQELSREGRGDRAEQPRPVTRSKNTAVTKEDTTADEKAAQKRPATARDVSAEQNPYKDIRIHVAPGLRS